MIGIIDFGMGNLGSVVNACAFLDLPARVLQQPDEAADCAGLILPGQGAFADCMTNLETRGFAQPLRQWIAEDRPLLGICVGLQVLFEGSAESPGVAGLGVLPGSLQKFEQAPERKVPQMGWNRVRLRGQDPLFEGVEDGAHMYFVHSYYVAETEADWVVGRTEYGPVYTSAVRFGRVAAFQFHPEKSQSCGLQLLRNFGASL